MDSETLTLTRELIDACKRNGAFTTATIKALGLTWKVATKGWTRRLIGKIILKADYERALEGRNILATKRQSNAPPNVAKTNLRDRVRDLQARLELVEAQLRSPPA